MTKKQRDCSRIVLRDWHDGPHAVDREVSLVAHIEDMAAEEQCSPDRLLRALVSESPCFRAYMAEYWAGVKK